MIIKSPLKYQGSKTKLINWIEEIAQYTPDQKWIEPFMGSGVVGFNINPSQALYADSNPHVIELFNNLKEISYFVDSFYTSIKSLSNNLQEQGEPFYYEMRKEYNIHKQAILLMFLNHTSYNGVMRFNRKGEYNVPFGKNKDKLSENYCKELQTRLLTFKKRITDEWFFITESYENVIVTAGTNDLIYCDPPYIERVSTYYGAWGDKEERLLHELLSNTSAKFVLSTWIEAKGERNPYFDELWSGFNVHTKEHLYRVGPKTKNRYPAIEALVTNY